MSYVICFWDKSKIQIDDSVAEVLKKLILTEQIKTFELGNGLYAVSSVEKIISKQDAYDTFPDQWKELQSLTDTQPPTDSRKLSSGNDSIIQNY